MHRFLCIVGTALIALSGPVFAQSGSETEILPLERVRPGQIGYGLSVFGGVQPSRFEVEVLGIWRNTAPDTSFILARLEGNDLEETGVIAGMSGSPVYIEGKLAGAVSFAWPFSNEPVAGITPIESMQRLLESYAPHGAAIGSGAAVASLESIAALSLPDDLLQRRLAQLAIRPLSEAASGVVWSAHGFSTATRDLLAANVGNLVASGRTTGIDASNLIPGASVAAVLVGGDLQLAATGTVTSRSESRLLAFGHPFLDMGAVELPMATAEVVTVLSSRLSSFKIANLGEQVGTVDLDRMTGIRGRIGPQARTTAMTVKVEGGREDTFAMELARLPTMTPILAAISMLGALEATTQSLGEQGLDLAVEFDLGEAGELLIEQSFDSAAAGMEAATYLLALSDYLLNNRLDTVTIEQLNVHLRQHPESRVATLVEGHATRTLVRPGDRVGLNLDFAAFRGPHWRQALEVTIPTGIPDGRYSLLVGDGVSIDVARITLEQSTPINFDQALDFLAGLHSRRDLVVLGVFADAGLSVAGEVLPRLPSSIRSLWSAASSTSAVPLQLALAQQQELELEVPIEGAVRIDLDVRREGPLSPEDSGVESETGSPGGEESGEGESTPSPQSDRGSQKGIEDD